MRNASLITLLRDGGDATERIFVLMVRENERAPDDITTFSRYHWVELPNNKADHFSISMGTLRKVLLRNVGWSIMAVVHTHILERGHIDGPSQEDKSGVSLALLHCGIRFYVVVVGKLTRLIEYTPTTTTDREVDEYTHGSFFDRDPGASPGLGLDEFKTFIRISPSEQWQEVGLGLIDGISIGIDTGHGE